MTTAYQIGCIGVAGYAAQLIGCLDESVPLEQARLAAVDVSRSSPNERIAEVLKRHDTAFVDGVPTLLAHDRLDAVLIATSIDSHLPYTTDALRAGLHVHCEKPITATIQDAAAMIAERDRAGRCVHVGYQAVYAPATHWAKRLILDGAIGRLRRVRVVGCWPRPDHYFNRNDWAGRLRRDGRWVLDSPANNALAHQVNLALHLSGADAHTTARPVALEAELYRARDIENYDTCAIRGTTDTDVQWLICLTHACRRQVQATVEWIGDAGFIRRVHQSSIELHRDGRMVEQREDTAAGGRAEMMTGFIDRLAGRADRSCCEIENAMQTTRLVNGASAAAPVRPVDPAHVRRVPTGSDPDNCVNAITGIEELFGECFERFALPGELGAAWAGPAGKLDMHAFDRFDGPPDA